MVLFFLILGIIILVVGVLLFSKIIINIEKIDNKTKKEEYIIKISFNKFGINIFKIYLTKQKLNNSIKKNLANLNKNKIKLDKKEYINIKKELKKSNIKLEKLDLNIAVGLEDCVITAYLVGIIYIIISNIIPHIYNDKKSLEEYKYKIIPIYNKNFSKFSLNCIISVKLVHIIYIIFLIWKGSKKNERTPNRKSYEYSYE